MERKEPTLSSSAAISDAQEQPARRSAPPDDAPTRPVRKPAPQVVHTAPAQSGSLPVIALLLALVAVAGAGFLGWQLFQAQVQLKQAEGRILGLEQQLNLSSEESSASLVGLQANVKKVDGDLRKVIGNAEDLRKSIAANAERTSTASRDIAQVKKDGAELKTSLVLLKKEVDTGKANAEAAVGKLDLINSNISQQSISVQQLREEVSQLKLELPDVDGLVRRTKANEDAISAIDDFRRSTNRELLQIKQQMSAIPK